MENLDQVLQEKVLMKKPLEGGKPKLFLSPASMKGALVNVWDFQRMNFDATLPETFFRIARKECKSQLYSKVF